MKWKLFFQIVLLMIIAGSIFYIVYPKYEFFHKLDDKSKDLTNYFRCNKITGRQEISIEGLIGYWAIDEGRK